MTLIDTHAHLEQIKDLSESLVQAREQGVEAIVGVGVNLVSNQRNIEIKREFQDPTIYLALGIHPSEIQDEKIDASIEFIIAHLGEAVAIGEIGLDFWYKRARKDTEVKDRQKDVFRRQLVIAQKSNLPVIIHSRGAWQVCLEMVRELDMHQGVFHWYSGPLDVLEEILDQGFYVSATPSLAYSPQARAAIKAAPLERVLLETDSPVFYKDKNSDEEGFRATPRDVFRTWDLVSQLKGVNPEDVARICCANARRVFNLMESVKRTVS